MLALVIDDSRAMRAILKNMLRPLGFGIAEASNGREGLAQLRQVRPDVVLVDWNMPEMNGLEFLQEVRADPAFSGLPLMMVTTETEEAQISVALKAGADDYLVKPFDRTLIAAKLGLLGLAVS